MMHKLPRPAFFFKLHFYYGRSPKKDVPTKEVKNSLTPRKNIVKEIQRLPTKEASILLQFIELPCCFFEVSCCFLTCIFLFMAVSFEINVTSSCSEFARTRVVFFQFSPKFRQKLNLKGIQNSLENILASF